MRGALVLLLGVSTVANGQQSWSDLKRKDNVNFFDVQQAFYQEWANKSYTKHQGYKQFKRWENFWEYRINPDGTFPKYEDMLKSRKAFLNKQNLSKSAGSGYWSPIGPFDHVNTDSWSAGQGRVNVITEDPNNSSILYVGTPGGGIWKSTDNGSTWAALGDDLPVIGVSGIAVSPLNSNEIYISTGDYDGGDTYSIGVYKSIDGGTTWNPTGSINSNNTAEIIAHPTTAGLLFLAGSSGIWRTDNGGTTWTNVQTGYFDDVAFKPGDPSTVYGTTKDDFYYSTDGGLNFSQASGLPVNSGRIKMSVTPANTSYVYLVISDPNGLFADIYRSTNSGLSFTGRGCTDDVFDGSGQAYYDLDIAVSSTNANTVFVGVLNVHRSTDGGSNFSQINNWSNPNGNSYTHADIHFLEYFGNSFYCGSDGGIYRSTNNGNSFTDLTAGLQIGQFYTIAGAESDPTVIAGGLQDNGGYAWVGGVWKNYYGADGMESAVDPSNPNRIYGMIQNGSLYTSSNGGNTNNSLGSPDNGAWITPMQIDPNNTNRLIVGYDDIWEYVGGNWNQLSTFNFPGTVRKIEIFEGNSSIIYAATTNSLYKSTNGGVSWASSNNGMNTGAGITSIETHPTDANQVWVTLGGSTSTNRVYFSSNGGSSWTALTGNLPQVQLNIIKYEHNTNGGVYVGSDIGIYYYDNNNAQWSDFSNQLPNVVITDLEINNTHQLIRAGSYGRGVWESASCNAIIASDDAGIANISSPSGSICGIAFTPQFTLRNYGTNALSSVTIHWDTDGLNAQSMVWNGPLASLSDTVLTLPASNATPGTHVFNIWTSLPNGVVDGNLNNDANQNTFTPDLNSVGANINVTTDCWGSETSWELYDASATVIATGGPYTDGTPLQVYSSPQCLTTGCYDLKMIDSYGDGVNGSQWTTCNDDGDASVTDNAGVVLTALTSPNFGLDTTMNFCVAGPLVAYFTTSATSICVGNLLTFINQSSGNVTSYNWSVTGPATFNSTVVSPQFTFTTPGVYDVSLTISDGSGTDTHTETAYITVNPSPTGTASGTDETCETYCDGSVSVNGTGGNPPYVYNWTGGLGSGQSFATVCPGTYNVLITDANNCSFPGLSATVNGGAPTPTASFTPSAQTVFLNTGATVTFTDASTGGTSWMWDFGDTNTSTDQSPVHTYTAIGTYDVTLTVTNAGGCAGVETMTIQVLQTNAISELDAEKLVLVYPNPAGGLLTVDCSDLADVQSLQIYNTLGELIVRQANNRTKANWQVDLSTWAEGMYYLHVQHKEGVVVKEITVLH